MAHLSGSIGRHDGRRRLSSDFKRQIMKRSMKDCVVVKSVICQDLDFNEQRVGQSPVYPRWLNSGYSHRILFPTRAEISFEPSLLSGPPILLATYDACKLTKSKSWHTILMEITYGSLSITFGDCPLLGPRRSDVPKRHISTSKDSIFASIRHASLRLTAELLLTMMWLTLGPEGPWILACVLEFRLLRSGTT